jgi:hypothetical protein
MSYFDRRLTGWQLFNSGLLQNVGVSLGHSFEEVPVGWRSRPRRGIRTHWCFAPSPRRSTMARGSQSSLRLAENGRASEAFATRNAKGASLIGANRTLLGCDSQDFCLAGIRRGVNSAGTDVQGFALLDSKFCVSGNWRSELLASQRFIEYAILRSRPNNCTHPSRDCERNHTGVRTSGASWH